MKQNGLGAFSLTNVDNKTLCMEKAWAEQISDSDKNDFI